MSDNQAWKSLPILPLAISGAVVLIGVVLLCVTALLVFGSSGAGKGQPTPTTEVSDSEGLMSFPTITAAFTDTPIPTDTPAPSPTQPPTPTGTNTLVPTNPPPPPPTNTPLPTETHTPVPPTATTTSGRLINIYFALWKTNLVVGEDIWFDFRVTNGTGGNLFVGSLGAVTYDVNWNVYGAFQSSYYDYNFKAGETLEWEDHRAPINQPGTYYLQLAVCYNRFNECDDHLGYGEWEKLSQPIQITVQ